jgi:hypothetical protein
MTDFLDIPPSGFKVCGYCAGRGWLVHDPRSDAEAGEAELFGVRIPIMDCRACEGTGTIPCDYLEAPHR